MSDQYIAEIRIFGCNYAPYGWAFCQGQLLQIRQNTALFSILGTYYGGDGINTFGLPNLQARIPVHQGQASSGNYYNIGDTGGQPQVALLTTMVPAHTHAFQASSRDANLNTPSAQTALARSTPSFIYKTPTGAPVLQPLAPGTITVAGNGIPHNNMMPYMALNFCIALQGIFPSRG